MFNRKAGALRKKTARVLGSSAGDGLPELFVNADPGSIIDDRVRGVIRSWPNPSEVTVPGLHFIQEDSGREIGSAVAAWLQGL
ncbi:MAG: hypothetical protein WCE80_00040 [Acidimicrobiia bacterium]